VKGQRQARQLKTNPIRNCRKGTSKNIERLLDPLVLVEGLAQGNRQPLMRSLIPLVFKVNAVVREDDLPGRAQDVA
jgi:hypothetical protein